MEVGFVLILSGKVEFGGLGLEVRFGLVFGFGFVFVFVFVFVLCTREGALFGAGAGFTGGVGKFLAFSMYLTFPAEVSL